MAIFEKMYTGVLDRIVDESNQLFYLDKYDTNKEGYVNFVELLLKQCNLCEKTCGTECVCRCHNEVRNLFIQSCSNCNKMSCNSQTCTCNCHVLGNNSLLNKSRETTPTKKKASFNLKRNQLNDEGVKSEIRKKKTTMLNSMLAPPKDDVKFTGIRRTSKFTSMLHPENVVIILINSLRKQKKN